MEFFKDPNFPADITSIFDPSDFSGNSEFYTSIEWKRPFEIYPDGYRVFPENMDPNSIKQG